MKRSSRKFISVILCLCMLFESMIFSAAAVAEEAKVFEDGYTTDSITSTLNQSSSGVSSAKGSDTGSATASSDATDEEKATAAQGNEKAAAQMKKLDGKDAEISAGSKSVAEATAQEDNSSVNALTKLTAGIQKVLLTVGKALQTIGKLLKTVGQALQAIGAVLKLIPWTAAVGAALQSVGKTIYKIGTVVEMVGNVLVKTGEAAANADNTFGGLLEGITSAVKEGWKKGGEEADAYSESLASKLKAADTSTSMEGASETTEDSSSETVEDAEQGDIADI